MFAGTTERVCLISGNAESIRKVHSFIMDRIREKPDLSSPKSGGEGDHKFDRHKQVGPENNEVRHN